MEGDDDGGGALAQPPTDHFLLALLSTHHGQMEQAEGGHQAWVAQVPQHLQHHRGQDLQKTLKSVLIPLRYSQQN